MKTEHYEIKEIDYDYTINGVNVEKVFQNEEHEYRIIDRVSFIDELIDWIGEATKDKELMKEDLKYLFSLNDEYVYSSIDTNAYIAYEDNEDTFNRISKEILDLAS